MVKSSARRAYSYVRFSTAKQADGGSLTRQVALSKKYCDRKKLILDESLTLHDLGVSAFRGDNVREGALAGFLEACCIGRVPRGSVLIVESLDRLSRNQIRPALQLFLALQDFGITIVTIEPEREYSPDSADALALIEPLIIFARAHEESATKSHRRRDGWKQARDKARQGGGPMMRTCPAWLEVTDGGFSAKPKAAAVVRRIFEMARDGLGVQRIVQRLRRDIVPSIGKGCRETGEQRWVTAYVYKILASPAAMGTYQPRKQQGKKVVADGEPIPGYYPAVVSEREWREAQAALQARAGENGLGGRFVKGGRAPAGAGRKGRDDGETNLFTGLVTYAIAGERMHLTHGMGRKNGDGERKRYVYLTPTRETAEAHGRPRIDYGVFETAILSRLRELQAADVASDSGRAGTRQSEILRLSGRLVDLDNRLERAQQKARTAGDFDAFLDLIAQLQAERREVSEQVAELRQQEESQPGSNLGDAHSLIDLLDRTPAAQRDDLRRRLKGRIRQLVAGIHVVIVARGATRLCAAQVRFHTGATRDYLIVHETARGYAAKNGAEGRRLVRSLPNVGAKRGFDFRRRDHAAALAKLLTTINVEKLISPA